MSKIICCAICGTVKDRDTIDGCYANARRLEVAHLLFVPTKFTSKNDDFAHIWVKQPAGLPTIEWKTLAERRGPC